MENTINDNTAPLREDFTKISYITVFNACIKWYIEYRSICIDTNIVSKKLTGTQPYFVAHTMEKSQHREIWANSVPLRPLSTNTSQYKMKHVGQSVYKINKTSETGFKLVNLSFYHCICCIKWLFRLWIALALQYYHIYLATRWGFPLSRMTTNN